MNTSDVADSLPMDVIMAKAVAKGQSKSKLEPIFLKRTSFAATAVSTSSLWLDHKAGGGIPPSKVIGISGPERAGKSLLATEIMKNQMDSKRHCSYMDAEGSTDPMFLENRGIDFKNYLGQRTVSLNLKKDEFDYIHYYQPSTGNEMLNFIHEVASALPEDRNPLSPPMIFLLDSVVALIPDEILADVNKGQMANHARMYAKMVPIINQALIRTGCSFVYTNQLREKPGVQYGPSTYEPCGETLKYFSSMRLQLSQAKPKMDGKDHPFVSGFVPSGVWKAGGVWEEPHINKNGDTENMDRYVYTAIRTVKNKMYTPYQICWMRIQFEENGGMGHGLDPVFDTFSFLLDNGYITKGKVSPEEKEAGMKVSEVANKYEITADTNYNLKKLKLPHRFDYYEFKNWVYSVPNLTRKLRTDMIVSGLSYQNT